MFRAFGLDETHVLFGNVRFAEAKRPKILEMDLVTCFCEFGLGETHVFKKNVRFVEAKRLKTLEPHFVTLFWCVSP